MTAALHWKAATRTAIAAAGGLDAAAALLGLSTTQLSRCQTPHHSDLLSTAHALALAEHTGARGFGEVFAHLSGHRLEPVAETPPPPQGRMTAAAATLSECAEFCHRAAEAMRDGRISDAELADLKRCLAEVAETADDLMAQPGASGGG